MLSSSEMDKEILQVLEYLSALDNSLFPLRSVAGKSLKAAKPGFHLYSPSDLILVLPA